MNNYTVALEQKAEQDTDFYIEGRKEGEAGRFRPSHPEIAEWYAGWSEAYQKWCIQTQRHIEYGGSIKTQGYLCVSYKEIKEKLNKDIRQIADYDGWQVNLEFLDIEIITFDHEDPKSETAWYIHSDNFEALKILGNIFGMEKVQVKRPVDEIDDVFGAAA